MLVCQRAWYMIYFIDLFFFWGGHQKWKSSTSKKSRLVLFCVASLVFRLYVLLVSIWNVSFCVAKMCMEKAREGEKGGNYFERFIPLHPTLDATDGVWEISVISQKRKSMEIQGATKMKIIPEAILTWAKHESSIAALPCSLVGLQKNQHPRGPRHRFWWNSLSRWICVDKHPGWSLVW